MGDPRGNAQPNMGTSGFWSAETPPLLTWDALVRYREAADHGTDGPEIWRALAAILPHLESNVALVEEVDLGPGDGARLSMFRLDDPGRQYYVAASCDGVVTVGSALQLQQRCSLPLAEFDSNRHEIVSVAVTSKLRYIGARRDLWVVVRHVAFRGQPSQLVAYHGTVGLNAEGHVILEASRDDETRGGGGWLPGGNADRLPAWLLEGGASLSSDVDPFDAPPAWPNPVNHHPVGTGVQAWSKTWFCHSVGTELSVRRAGESFPRLWLPAWSRVNGLGVVDVAEGRAFGVAATRARLLLAFEVDGDIREVWHQRLGGVAAAVALPGTFAQDGQDLFVLLERGALQRLRVHRQKEFRKLWRDLREKPPALTQDPRCWPRSEPHTAAAAVVGAMDTYLEDLHSGLAEKQEDPEFGSRSNQANASRVEAALARLVELFGPDADPVVVAAAVRTLMRRLILATRTERPARGERDSPGRHYLIEAIHAVYAANRHGHVELRGHMDRVFRAINWEGQRHFDQSDCKLKQLRKWAERNREAVFREWSKVATGSDLDRASHAVFALERWASALLPFDSTHASRLRGNARPMALAWLTGRDAPILAVALPNRLVLHSVDECLRLRDPAKSAIEGEGTVIEGEGTVEATVAVGDGADTYLAVGGKPGVVLLYRRAESGGPTKESLQEITAIRIDGEETAVSLATCLQPSGESVLAIGVEGPTGCRIRVGHLVAGVFHQLTLIEPELSRIGGMAIAVNGVHLQLCVGPATRGYVLFYPDLGESGQAKDPVVLRTLSTRALSITFDSRLAPSVVAIGDARGFIWCQSLPSQGGASQVHWLHALSGGATAIEALTIDGRRHFAVASDAGELLVMTADGERVFSHEMLSPVGLLAATTWQNRTLLAVAMVGGWVTLFGERRDADEALGRVLSCADLVAKAGLWQGPEARSVRSVLTLRDGGPVSQALAGLDRTGRTRVLRFAASSGKSLGTEELSGLSDRELRLYLSYLPARQPGPVEAVTREIYGRPPSDSDPGGVSAATVAAAMRRAAAKADPESVIQFLPPASHLAQPWVAMEAALLLLRAVRSTYQTREVEPGELVQAMLPHLLRLPPSVLGALPKVVATTEAEVFRQLRSLCDDSCHVEEYVRLAPFLAAAAASPLLQLLAAASGFVEKVSGCDQDSWMAERRVILDALEVLRQATLGRMVGMEYLDELRTNLAVALPAQATPRANERMVTREEWVKALKTALAAPVGESGVGPWIGHAQRMSAVVRAALARVATLEGDALLREVRPILVAKGAFEPSDANQVVLRFEVSGEARSVVRDVAVRLDAGTAKGLVASDIAHKVIEFDVFPPSRERGLEFKGYVRPDQSQVSILVELHSTDGYRYEDWWTFPLQRPRVSGGLEPTLANLHALRARFVEELVAASDAVILVSIDAKLGRQQVLDDYSKRRATHVFDLDGALRSVGRGRKYSEQTLTAEFITSVLEGAKAPQGADLVVCSADETVQRVLDDEPAGAAGALLDALACRPSQGGRWLMIVGSGLAARLRRIHRGRLRECAAHRLLWGAGRDEQASAVRALAVAAALDQAKAYALLDGGLGWDLRFVGPALAALAAQSHVRAALSHQVVGIASVIEVELASLASLDLVVLLVAALAETTLLLDRVSESMISARDHRSTTQRGPQKTVQSAGTPFDARSLQALRSDRAATDRVMVRGFSTAGTAEAKQTCLLPLVQRLKNEERVGICERLRALGFASWSDEVLLARAPYEAYIRDLYVRLTADPPMQRDRKVFNRILGDRATPAETLSMADVGTLPNEDLQRLLPGASSDDVRRLARIARLWHAEGYSETDFEPALGNLFSPRRVTRLQADRRRLDIELANLPAPVLSVGEAWVDDEHKLSYPDEYVVWAASSDDGASLNTAIQVCTTARATSPTGRQASLAAPRVLLIGPGADARRPDPERCHAVLGGRDFVSSAWEGDLLAGLRRRAQVQLRLTALSPFQTSGALPPGSRLFVGREKELDFICLRVDRASVLIVGGRRVGKTSLLNQVRHRLSARGLILNGLPVTPVYVDLQGVSSPEAFDRAFAAALASATLNPDLADLATLPLEQVAARLRQQCWPVFLFNEVDGLAPHSATIGRWRKIHEEGLARFVMVGYSAIALLGVADHPLFHFTEGDTFGGKALSLTALSREAAVGLLSLLEGSELQLRWETPEQRQQGTDLLIERSYRIPWILQRFGQLIVERTEREREPFITLRSVRDMLHGEGHVVWEYVNGIEYHQLSDGQRRAGESQAYRLVLFAVARYRYFLGDKPPIQDARIATTSPLDEALCFTVGEALEIVQGTLRDLGGDSQVMEAWFDRLDLAGGLRKLTLTLALEPHPAKPDTYGFLLHILPLELRRHHPRDPTLDELILNAALEFGRQLKGEI